MGCFHNIPSSWDNVLFVRSYWKRCSHTYMHWHPQVLFVLLETRKIWANENLWMMLSAVPMWYRVHPRLPWLSWCCFVRDVSLFFGRKFLMFLSFSQCRCGFYLHPAEGSPAPNITQGKLSAPRILRIHKVRCSQNHWSTANARCCKMVNPPNTQWYKWLLVVNGRISSAWRQLFVSTVNWVCMHAFVASE